MAVTIDHSELDSSPAREKERAGESKADQVLSRAAAKTLEILAFLRDQEAPLSLNDIARHIGLTKASTFRLLQTLEVSGYLSTPVAGMYKFVPEFGSAIPSRLPMQIVKAATPFMRDLSSELRETVSLAMLFENRGEVVAVAESNEIIRMSNVVGHILPPNASSLGKVITAFQSSLRREKLLRSFGVYRFTEHTITDPAGLEREYQEIRERGFARDAEETVYGGICYGVPIASARGHVVAALSTSMPKMRLRDATQENSVIARLTAVGKSVAANLS
ncbi:MAG TPA: IclR family transcriptional regulator [Bryobacteraceae bacterium]|nr:IclR family transcriptional regulator [Bryobacteraceae bacterium]